MFWHLIDAPELKPRFYLSGFPKAGLHLLTLTVQGICRPYRDTFGDHWAGTHEFNSWSLVESDLRYILFRIAQIPPAHYVQAHAAHYEELELMLRWSGVGHVMIYRDLRDVAVSQTHHILSEDDRRFKHPAKAAYRALGGFDEALGAVIEGLGPFAGVMDRWVGYTPWLDDEDTLCVKYEDMRHDVEAWARKILEHGLGSIYGLNLLRVQIEGSLFDKNVERMVSTGTQHRLSPTFRKGEVGGWREEFTEEHKELFKRCDPDHWLVRLGYEDDDNW